MPDPFPFNRSGETPFAGLTFLAVEDSRYASDALRLLCQGSGARLRRAETMATARRHLLVYRPDVVIVDLGLPDGPGTELIAELATGLGGFDGPILALSGTLERREAALAAGAATFLEKPLESLSAFQRAVMRHLPQSWTTSAASGTDRLIPDRQALRDDLIHAANLAARGDGRNGYVAGFVRSLARMNRDTALDAAACNAAQGGARAMDRLEQALTRRLQVSADPFGHGGTAGVG